MSNKLYRAMRSDEFTNDNPILDAGETGYEIDTKKAKLGNGNDTYAILTYVGTGSGTGGGIATGRSLTASTTAGLADANTRIIASHATVAIVLTIPNDATINWPADTSLTVYQELAATASFAAGAGVTLRAPTGTAVTSVQFGLISVLKVGANEWTAI